MPADVASEIEVFHRFLTVQLTTGSCDLTPEESVAAFREYQQDRERFQRDIQPALEQLDRGEGRTIDFDRLKQEVTQRLADEGITE